MEKRELNRYAPRLEETSLAYDVWRLVRYWFVRPRVLIGTGVGLVAVGVVMNWNWLVATGVAPLLLGVLPCVAMCALGMCMSRGADGACSKTGNSDSELPSGTVTRSTSANGHKNTDELS